MYPGERPPPRSCCAWNHPILHLLHCMLMFMCLLHRVGMNVPRLACSTTFKSSAAMFHR